MYAASSWSIRGLLQNAARLYIGGPMHLAQTGAPPLATCLGTVSSTAETLVIRLFPFLLVGVTVPFGFIYPLHVSCFLQPVSRYPMPGYTRLHMASRRSRRHHTFRGNSHGQMGVGRGPYPSQL